MRSGLRRFSATFQRVMKIMLVSVKWELTLMNLHDIVVLSRTAHQQMNHTVLALMVFRKTCDSLKMKKCSKFSIKLHYPGHFICPCQVDVTTHHADDMRGFETRVARTERQSIIGSCHIVPGFVPSSAQILSRRQKDWENRRQKRPDNKAEKSYQLCGLRIRS